MLCGDTPRSAAIVYLFVRIMGTTKRYDPMFDLRDDRDLPSHSLETPLMRVKEIAAALHLSVRTVQNHAAQVRRKLGIGSRTALVRFALRAPLADTP